MDFELSEELKLFQNAIQDFAQKEIAPLVKEAEENEETPRELFSKMGKLGYLCPDYPEEYGGGGMGKIAECIMVEEVSKVCSGIASGFFSQAGLATRIIANHGSEEQKQEYLVPAIAGDKIASFGLTESEAGSDAANLQTTAVKKGDNYIINGGKIYITNGQYCDYVVLAAVTDKSKGSRGISIFVMDSDTKGFSRTKMQKLGNHASVTSQLYFDDCPVPAKNLVGEEGRGWKYVLEALNSARIAHSARSIGTAQAALEACINYSKERVQFGQPIGKFQAIAFKISEMATQIEAARALLYRVAWLFDEGNDCRKEGPMTKLFSADVAIQAVQDAMRIHAGAGYVGDTDVERLYRDAILYHSTEGTGEIQKLIISRELSL